MHTNHDSRFSDHLNLFLKRLNFSEIDGHGNMVRKMGIYYDRLDIAAADSHGDGARVSVSELVIKIKKMLHQIVEQATCVLPAVIEDPYLEGLVS